MLPPMWERRDEMAREKRFEELFCFLFFLSSWTFGGVIIVSLTQYIVKKDKSLSRSCFLRKVA